MLIAWSISYGLPFIIGACLGSFYSVLVYRIPRGESIVRPGSHCPHCNAPIRPWNNIPVLSFILQGGRCTQCRARISFLYPGLELGTGILVTIFWHTSLPYYTSIALPARMVFCFLVTLLIPLSIIDIHKGILPHQITVPGIIAAVGLAFVPGGITPIQMLYGLVAGGGCLWLISKVALLFVPLERRIDGAAVGGGDIMLLLLYGALSGPFHILFALALGSVVALAFVPFKRKHQPGAPFAFGPFLAAGIVLSLLWGNRFLSWYISLL